MDKKALIVIPARMQSTRLPGKPLADVNGLPLLWQTHHQANKVGCPVVVATSDQEIIAFCASANMNHVRTAEHWCGTARAWEAADPAADVIINWQADEPEVDPDVVLNVIMDVNEYHPIITVVSDLRSFQSKKINTTKAIVARRNGRCHWFTRSDVPGAMAHVGVYCFTRECLNQVGPLPQSPISKLESLEQLTWLEHGFTIHAAKTDKPARGIDTQQDLEELRWRLANHE